MNEHVLDWIGAYLDCELHDDRRRWVESHLRACDTCRAELEALQGLRVQLQASPPMPARTPPEQFVAQVRLRLPPRSAPVAGRARLRQAAGLWLPLGVLGLWALGQAVLSIGGLVVLAWGQVGLEALGQPVVGVVELLALEAVLTVVAAGLVWGCMASWWAARDTEAGLTLASSGETAQ